MSEKYGFVVSLSRLSPLARTGLRHCIATMLLLAVCRSVYGELAPALRVTGYGLRVTG